MSDLYNRDFYAWANQQAALLRAGLVDRLVWFRAPRLMGGDGHPAAMPFGIDHLSETPQFQRVDTVPVGEDLMELYRKL